MEEEGFFDQMMTGTSSGGGTELRLMDPPRNPRGKVEQLRESLSLLNQNWATHYSADSDFFLQANEKS